MSWESTSRNPVLLPLPCWVFYITHPYKPSEFDGCAFFNRLEDEEGAGGCSYFRIEFFFLPGATAEECHTHYVAETKARGTIWDSILKVKAAVELKERESNVIAGGAQETQDLSSNQDFAGNGHLPGLIMGETHDMFQYRSWFFIYADANPDCSGPEGLTREMYFVQSDPMPGDMEEGDKFNPMDYPVYSEQVKARGEDGFEGGLTGWMNLLESSQWQEEAIDATKNALKLGWKSW